MATITVSQLSATSMELEFATQLGDDVPTFASQEFSNTQQAISTVRANGIPNNLSLDDNRKSLSDSKPQQTRSLYSLLHKASPGHAKTPVRGTAGLQARSARKPSIQTTSNGNAARISLPVSLDSDKPRPRKRVRLTKSHTDLKLANKRSYLFERSPAENWHEEPRDPVLNEARAMHIQSLCDQSKMEEVVRETKLYSMSEMKAVLQFLSAPTIKLITEAIRRPPQKYRVNPPASLGAPRTSTVGMGAVYSEAFEDSIPPSSPPSLSDGLGPENRDHSRLVTAYGSVQALSSERERSASPLAEWSQTPPKGLYKAQRSLLYDSRPPDSSYTLYEEVLNADENDNNIASLEALETANGLPAILESESSLQKHVEEVEDQATLSSDGLDIAEPIALAGSSNSVRHINQDSNPVEVLSSAASIAASPPVDVLRTPYVAPGERQDMHSIERSSHKGFVPNTLIKPAADTVIDLEKHGNSCLQTGPIASGKEHVGLREARQSVNDSLSAGINEASPARAVIFNGTETNRPRTPELESVPLDFEFGTPMSKSPGTILHEQRRRWFANHTANLKETRTATAVVEEPHCANIPRETSTTIPLAEPAQQTPQRQPVIGRASPTPSEVFGHFKAAYPDYLGTTREFRQVCTTIRNSGMHKSLWDDFVVTISNSLLENIADAASDPLDFYNRTVDEPTHHKRILNPDTLPLVLQLPSDTQPPSGGRTPSGDNARISTPTSRADTAHTTRSLAGTKRPYESSNSTPRSSGRVLPWRKTTTESPTTTTKPNELHRARAQQRQITISDDSATPTAPALSGFQPTMESLCMSRDQSRAERSFGRRSSGWPGGSVRSVDLSIPSAHLTHGAKRLSASPAGVHPTPTMASASASRLPSSAGGAGHAVSASSARVSGGGPAQPHRAVRRAAQTRSGSGLGVGSGLPWQAADKDKNETALQGFARCYARLGMHNGVLGTYDEQSKQLLAPVGQYQANILSWEL